MGEQVIVLLCNIMSTLQQKTAKILGGNGLMAKLAPADVAIVRWEVCLFFICIIAGITLADSQINSLAGYHAHAAFLRLATEQGNYSVTLAGTTWQLKMVSQWGEFYSVGRNLHVDVYGHALVIPTVWHINTAPYGLWVQQEWGVWRQWWYQAIRHF